MVILIRRIPLREKFSIGLLAITWLGSIISDFPKERILVVRIPISSTTPSTLPIFIHSPIRIDLSKSRAIEPKRFAAVSLAAKAKAKPPIPKPATNPATLMPQT